MYMYSSRYTYMNINTQSNNTRQKTFYDANKDRINALKRQARALLMQPIAPKPKNNDDEPPIIFSEDNVVAMINAMPMNELTRTKKIANVRIIFNAYPSTDLRKSISNYEQMKTAMETVRTIQNPEENYGFETQKTIVQTLLWCIVNLQIPIKKETFRKYESLVGILQQQSINQKMEDKNNEENAVIPYTDYLERIRNRFGVDSKAFLIASIYHELNCRDDLGTLVILTNRKGLKNPDINIVFVPKQGNGEIILNHYKTQSKYGVVRTILSGDLTNLIRNYITKHNLTNQLFPENETGLSLYVSRMNRDVCIKGGINVLRRMSISDFLGNPNLTLEEKSAMARKSTASG